ncbi:MAG: radical SAM protein [Lachnospiraceae bacterium]|nr:radical SAM protein [Lachnospiraceae bacterium]
MSIQINSFFGKIGFIARQKFPRLAADSYLKLQFLTRHRQQAAYTKLFLELAEKGEVPMPNVVNIETLNRCNSTCEFCSANIHAEKRPLRQMTDELYRSIIDQLADWGYKGHLTLYGNNEPLLDKRIVELHNYAREKLPDSFIFMSTNGLALNVEKLDALKPYINQLIINNYALEYKLHPGVQRVYDHVKAHPDDYRDLEIEIQMRYLKEVLTNRAGSAPNKKVKEKVITETCLLPFTDMWITPDGRMGLCCCDNFETTTLADLNVMPVREAWNSEAMRKARQTIATGRQNYPFCRHCDFIDAGFRMTMVGHILKGDQEAAHRAGGHERT